MGELVVLMKLTTNTDGNLEFIPEKVIKGNFIPDERFFLSYSVGNLYLHIGEVLTFTEPASYYDTSFFAYRRSIKELKEIFPNKTIDEIKDDLLNEAQKYRYCIKSHPYTEISDIFKINKLTGNSDIFIDKDSDESRELAAQTRDLDDIKDTEVNLSLKDTDTIKKETYTFEPYKLKKQLKEYVFGQDEAIDKVVQSLWCNYYFTEDTEYEKENLLLMGPTGSGKTEIFRILKKLLPDITIHIADLSPITESGYEGLSLNSIFKALLIKCIEKKDGREVINLEKAKHSIAVLDEFDKIAFKRNESSSDVGNEPVQQELLKLLEGTEISIDMKLNGIPETILLDTTHITFACCGAFEGITKTGKRKIGYNQADADNQKSYAEVTNEDLVKYGYLSEIIGRIPCRVPLKELSLDILVKIIKSGKKSLFSKRIAILKTLVNELNINEDIFTAIAEQAIKENTGARSINEKAVDIFGALLDDISNPNFSYLSLNLNKEIVENHNSYKLIKEPKG